MFRQLGGRQYVGRLHMKIETITDNDFTMRYFRFGIEGGSPAVIIPGISAKSVMGFADAVAAQYSRLAEKYDVFLFDTRDGIEPWKAYQVEKAAGDLARAMDLAGITGASVIGVSHGGMIAQSLVCTMPDLVRALVLCSTSPRSNSMSDIVLGDWARYADDRKIPELMASFADNVYSRSFLEKYRDAVLSMGDTVTEEDLGRLSALVKGALGFDMTEREDSHGRPVLVVGAEDDQVFGAAASEELAGLMSGECYIYENYGHAVYDEAPDFVDRVRDFFDRV